MGRFGSRRPINLVQDSEGRVRPDEPGQPEARYQPIRDFARRTAELASGL